VSPLVLIALALITYVSRAVAVVLLPRPSARFETILSRIPAPTLAASAGALLLSPGRSLLLCLIGGAVGYAAGALLG